MLKVSLSAKVSRASFAIVAAFASMLAAPGARAADYLRGSFGYEVGTPNYFQWSGVYGGGQIGYSFQGANFGDAGQSLVNYVLRNSTIQDNLTGWTTLPDKDTNGSSFGGFIGYNYQWDDVIVGVEANYNRMNFNTLTATDSLTRTFVDNAGALPNHNLEYRMTVAANASVQFTDLATFRVRGGWVNGNFLPYGFAGLAVGRANVATTATVSGTVTETDGGGALVGVSNITLPAQSEIRNGMFVYGWTAGLGMDWAITPNFFLRAEWEWVNFSNVDDLSVHFNSARIAAGFKF
ncbi:MAG: outer membrane protein [Pseudorhodoplanes sp.]